MKGAEIMKVFVLDTEDQSFNFVETEGGLSEWYRLLHCDLIDITERKIGGKYFDVICDDEGLFNENPIVSAMTESGEPRLVGSIAICNHDGEGHETGLSFEDQKLLVMKQAIATRADGEKFKVIILDE